jgi:hypothetical protein
MAGNGPIVEASELADGNGPNRQSPLSVPKGKKMTKQSDILAGMKARTVRAAQAAVPEVDMETTLADALTLAKESGTPRVRYAMVGAEGHALLCAFVDLSEPDYQTAVGESYQKDGKTLFKGGTVVYASAGFTVKDSAGKTVVLSMLAKETAKERRSRGGKPRAGVPVRESKASEPAAEAGLFTPDED